MKKLMYEKWQDKENYNSTYEIVQTRLLTFWRLTTTIVVVPHR